MGCNGAVRSRRRVAIRRQRSIVSDATLAPEQACPACLGLEACPARSRGRERSTRRDPQCGLCHPLLVADCPLPPAHWRARGPCSKSSLSARMTPTDRWRGSAIDLVRTTNPWLTDFRVISCHLSDAASCIRAGFKALDFAPPAAGLLAVSMWQVTSAILPTAASSCWLKVIRPRLMVCFRPCRMRWADLSAR